MRCDIVGKVRVSGWLAKITNKKIRCVSKFEYLKVGIGIGIHLIFNNIY